MSADIRIIKQDRDSALEKMLDELGSLKSSLASYQKQIRRELNDGVDEMHRRDNSCEWIKCHYERFMEARIEFLEKKAYLLAYEDTKMDKETIEAGRDVMAEAEISALGDGNREVAKAVNILDNYIERTENNA